jgi:hypothetical protein
MRRVQQGGALTPQPHGKPHMIEVQASRDAGGHELRVSPGRLSEDVAYLCGWIGTASGDDEPELGSSPGQAADEIDTVPELSVPDIQVIEAGKIEDDEWISRPHPVIYRQKRVL